MSFWVRAANDNRHEGFWFESQARPSTLSTKKTGAAEKGSHRLCTNGRTLRTQLHLKRPRLLAQPKAPNQGAIRFRVGALKVVEQLATTANHAQQTAA